MNKLKIIEDISTGQRRIFDSIEDSKTFIESCNEGIKFITFSDMTDKERFIILHSELIKAKSFDDASRGTGRTYDSSVKLGIEEFEWLLDKTKSSIKLEGN